MRRVAVVVWVVGALAGCMTHQRIDYVDQAGILHSKPVAVTTERRLMYLDPDSKNLVAQDVSGLHINLAVPGTGVGIGFSAGGATSMSAPEGSDLVVTNGATLDETGAMVGYNRRVETGQLTGEAEKTTIESIREMFRP